MEPLEMDDINFFPCTCGYQICRFCWHRIRTDENGLCPACRKQYPEDPADFKPLSAEELQRIKTEKRQKDQQRKQKLSENRKHLANVRVVQKNLVFVVGLPPRLADTDVLKKYDYFGKFGKIHKVVVNHTTTYAGSQGPSASAYVTYLKGEDALRAIQAVNNIPVDGRMLKSSLGTTKYCSHFLKNQQCPKADCMYLHELGDEAASFTKEEMQHGKHQEYEKKLHDQMLGTCNRKQTSSPTNQNQNVKELWPSLHGGKNSEQRINGVTKSNKEHKNGGGGGSKCRHGSGENHKSKRNHISEEKLHRNSSGKQPRMSNNTQSGHSPERRPPSRDSSNSAHSSTSSLNGAPSEGSQPQCRTPPDWSQSSSSSGISAEVLFENQQNHSAMENSPGSISPSYSESPTQSSPYGSLSSNTVPSPPALNMSPSPHIGSSNWTVESTVVTHNGILHHTAPHFVDSVKSDSVQIGPVNNRLPMECNITSLRHTQQAFPTGMGMGPALENGFSDMYCSKQRPTHLQNGDWLHGSENRRVNPEMISHHSSIRNHSENSSTDWQNVYDFGSSQKSQDDDLGFDPWDESSKGLADLLEKEACKRPENSFPFVGSPANHNLMNSSHHRGAPHMMEVSRLNNHYTIAEQQRATMMGPSIRRVAAPPPGFAPNHISNYTGMPRPPFSSDHDSEHLHSLKQSTLNGPSVPPFYQDSHLESRLRSENHMKNMNSGCMPNHRPKQAESFNNKDWQEGLRSLLPNISISFGPSVPNSANQIGARMNPGPPKNHTAMWNSQNTDHPWPAQDIPGHSSGNTTDGFTESPPHWMKALQHLTLEDGALAFSNHQQIPRAPLFTYREAQWPATPSQMPPPGFSVPLRASAPQTISENL